MGFRLLIVVGEWLSSHVCIIESLLFFPSLFIISETVRILRWAECVGSGKEDQIRDLFLDLDVDNCENELLLFVISS